MKTKVPPPPCVFRLQECRRRAVQSLKKPGRGGRCKEFGWSLCVVVVVWGGGVTRQKKGCSLSLETITSSPLPPPTPPQPSGFRGETPPLLSIPAPSPPSSFLLDPAHLHIIHPLSASTSPTPTETTAKSRRNRPAFPSYSTSPNIDSFHSKKKEKHLFTRFNFKLQITILLQSHY